MSETADTIITRRDIDAMPDEALLPFARKHHGMLAERFSRRMDDFYNPRLLDEPYFLRRLYRLDPEQFTRLTQELNRREYIAGGHWAAVLLSQGGALPEDVLKKQEWAMPAALAETWRRSLDSALFLEVSEKARKLWTGQPARCSRRMTQCEYLSKALALREKWLGISHTASARLLCDLGWKPLDVMLAYLAGELSPYDCALDPDCALDAAWRDPETAARLMDPDSYRTWFEGELHPSNDPDMAKIWTRLLYFAGGWTDRAPLEGGHRLKRVNAFYQTVLKELQCPDRQQREFEEELRQAGLLPSETPLDWDSPKTAKRQRLALTRALVCHYQWRVPELLSALSAGKAEVFTSLVWGLYQEDQLTAAFLLDDHALARDADGRPVDLPPEGRVGLVSPVELDKKQLAAWKKRLKAAGAKPLIRQLSLPSAPPDFSRFEGAVTRHITLYSAAGKWGLDMGDPRPSHCRADLTDPLHGYGARIWFDRVWNGPEYSTNDVVVLGAECYRLDPIPFGDVLPRRAVISPKALPPRFSAAAGAAFQQLTGIK